MYIFSTIRVFFNRLTLFFNISSENYLTLLLNRPNIRPPLKRPYRLEA